MKFPIDTINVVTGERGTVTGFASGDTIAFTVNTDEGVDVVSVMKFMERNIPVSELENYRADCDAINLDFTLDALVEDAMIAFDECSCMAEDDACIVAIIEEAVRLTKLGLL